SAGVLKPSSALRDRLGSVCERQASCRHARAESPSRTRVNALMTRASIKKTFLSDVLPDRAGQYRRLRQCKRPASPPSRRKIAEALEISPLPRAARRQLEQPGGVAAENVVLGL